MNGHAQQIIVAQKFVSMKGKIGDDLSAAIMDAVIQTQRELEAQGMIGCTALVKQVIVTGQVAINATIIIDIMQIAMIQSPQQPPEQTKPKLIK